MLYNLIMKIKILLFLLIILVVLLCCKTFLIKSISNSKMSDEIIETVYTQDCFPRTLQQAGVTKKCFMHANIGEDAFCSKSELILIKEYYKKGQDKDPLNDGMENFCAD